MGFAKSSTHSTDPFLGIDRLIELPSAPGNALSQSYPPVRGQLDPQLGRNWTYKTPGN
jgi:hypothetical protein